jgi:hypothetical protein
MPHLQRVLTARVIERCKNAAEVMGLFHKTTKIRRIFNYFEGDITVETKRLL